MKSLQFPSRYPSLLFILLLLLCLMFATPFVSSKQAERTPVPQKSQSLPPQESPSLSSGERELQTGTPKHLPIKIKAKNVNNEKWEHDLEIEVTNTSNRPIYYLSFMLIIQDFKSSDGNEIAFWLHYGRGELNDFRTPLESTDVALMPNETCVLKIPESSATGWGKTRAKRNYPQPKKVGLVFQSLNFGDGTGFNDASGSPVNIHKKIGINQKCLSLPAALLLQVSNYSLYTGSFAPVNFFLTSKSRLLDESAVSLSTALIKS